MPLIRASSFSFLVSIAFEMPNTRQGSTHVLNSVVGDTDGANLALGELGHGY